MFFHRKKKNTLLHETYPHSSLEPLRKGVNFSFPNIFSAWKLGAMLFFVALAAGTLCYGLFFSSEFRITSVNVQGASGDDAQAITASVQRTLGQKILHLIPQNSYFLFPQAEMQKALQTEFPRLSSIIISRPNPNGVLVSVAERSITGIWCAGNATNSQEQMANGTNGADAVQTQSQTQAVSTQGQCAFFDENGVIFDQAPDATSGHLLFVVQDARPQSMPPLGSRVMDAANYAFLQNLRAALNNAGRIPISFTIKNDQEIDANFLDGAHAWNVYFSTGYSAIYQVDVLTRLLAQTIGDKNFPYLDYVDLRLENKAYYSVHPAG